MRIALVGLTHPFRGGISHYTTLLCRALRQRHEVELLALYRQYPSLLFPGKTQIDESDDSLAVEHRSCIDSINPYTWWSTSRLVAHQQADLLLVTWWHPFFAPSFGTIAHLARRRGIPTCFLCHNAIPHERSWIDGALLRYAFGAADVFITHSVQDQEDLERFYPDADVLRNPHPTYDVFATAERMTTEDARRKLGFEGKRVLLFFGFVREYKGLEYLMQAMLRLDPGEGYHLVVVGEFYESRDKYGQLIESLSERGQLTLVDRYVANEEVSGFFSAADLVMVPYLSATQSGVIQIAYAFNKPVVATTVGGIPEVVTDGDTGFLVPPGDAAALARAVQRFFALGAAGLERFQACIRQENEKYSWDRMVETIERVHEMVRGRS